MFNVFISTNEYTEKRLEEQREKKGQQGNAIV